MAEDFIVIEREQIEHEDKQIVTPDVVFESLPPEMKGRIEASAARSDPINILVIGQTGVGKSTLVNALMGGIVAKAQRGAKPVTNKMSEYEGEFMGVKIRVYDTVGFGDTEGRSDESIINEIASAIRFDLILICVRMDCRASHGVQKMFTLLSNKMPTDAWKRTVVVLTFANFFILQGIPGTSNEEKEREVTEEIEMFRNQISKAVNIKDLFSDVPFRIAGRIEETKLPTTDDWLHDLWCTCLQHCSDEALPLLVAYSVYAIITGVSAAIVGGSGALVGAGVGAAIGAIAGSVVPGGGTALGAALGAQIGAGVTGALGGVLGGIAGITTAVENLSKNPMKIKKEKND